MPSKKKSIIDPFFGKLTFDVIWIGSIDVPPLGEIEVTISGGVQGDLPTEEQRKAVSDLIHAMTRLLPTIYEALFIYYRDNREVYVPLAIDVDEEAPELASVDEIHRVLEGPPWLFVDCHGQGESPSLILAWGATFDDEHGIRVELINGEICDVGP